METSVTTAFKKGEVSWLESGINMLSEKGTSGINIDQLSEMTGKAKTSFYHFFESKAGFFERLALYWEYSYSKRYIDSLDRFDSSKEKFEELIHMAHSRMKDELVWVHLKELGQRNKEIAAIVERVEQERIELVTGILAGMGFEPNRAKGKAESFMYLFFGWSILNRDKRDQAGIDSFQKLVYENLLT